MKVAATLRVNGTDYPVELDPHVSLLKAVREELGLTGSKEGCDDSECGACMMLLDGEPVNACSYLALQAEGRDVTTVEGLAGDEEVGPLQRAFLQQAGVQCGFCTPGCSCPRPRCCATTRSHRGRDPDRAVREPLQVHGLPGDRPGSSAGRFGGVPPLAKAPVHADATPPHHAG
jgi:aerobic-type carbon monoxide dehydrogenase small subunit (CoxS/CutS family)